MPVDKQELNVPKGDVYRLRRKSQNSRPADGNKAPGRSKKHLRFQGMKSARPLSRNHPDRARRMTRIAELKRQIRSLEAYGDNGEGKVSTHTDDDYDSLSSSGVDVEPRSEDDAIRPEDYSTVSHKSQSRRKDVKSRDFAYSPARRRGFDINRAGFYRFARA